MPERLVSIKEAAELLGVSKSRLRAWDDSGKFSAVRTPAYTEYIGKQLLEQLC